MSPRSIVLGIKINLKEGNGPLLSHCWDKLPNTDPSLKVTFVVCILVLSVMFIGARLCTHFCWS